MPGLFAREALQVYSHSLALQVHDLLAITRPSERALRFVVSALWTLKQTLDNDRADTSADATDYADGADYGKSMTMLLEQKGLFLTAAIFCGILMTRSRRISPVTGRGQ